MNISKLRLYVLFQGAHEIVHRVSASTYHTVVCKRDRKQVGLRNLSEAKKHW